MTSRLPHLPVRLENNQEELGIRGLLSHCCENIWPDNTPSPSDVSIERLKISTSNKVYKCTWNNKSIMARVFGDTTSMLVDREYELEVTRVMSEHHLAAGLYLTFNNGYLIEYIQGSVLTLTEMRDPSMYPLIAQKIAQWHSVQLPPDALKKKGGIGKELGKWLEIAEEVGVPPENLKVAKEEVTILLSLLENKYASSSPFLMCHNDVNHGNILYNGNADDKIVFVDYEYSGYNFRGFDLGNHFCEWCGLDLEFQYYPDLTTRRDFLRYYLVAIGRLQEGALDNNNVEITERALESILEECEFFAQVSHMFWHIWALVFVHNTKEGMESRGDAGVPNADFGYSLYASKRLKEYFRRKSEFIKTNYVY